MAKTNKNAGPEARLPKGFRDIPAAEIRSSQAMLATIREVYERYGFEPLETPAIEFTDALGKFLPDQDRPNAGVFSFTDEDEQWMSLRYDLTAPLARYVAENFATLPKPFRRYATGPVFRNEKPGPGRFRQFVQFDADTVGTDSIAADAEMCMLAADTLEALGLRRQFRIRVSNRKILDGLLEMADVPAGDARTRGAVLRSLDKLDKFPAAEVARLLGPGRKDESGDFTAGAGLRPEQIELILNFVGSAVSLWVPPLEVTDSRLLIDAEYKDNDDSGTRMVPDVYALLDSWRGELAGSEVGLAGVRELREMQALWHAAGYGTARVQIDPSVVRGLEYYTGPVFEAELTFQVKDEDGNPVRFGSVGGGGRYDDLVSRFTGEKVPATGFSIGVSRLQAALQALGKTGGDAAAGPVVVLVMDKAEIASYQRLTQTLRQAGIRAEMYLGSSGMKAQMKYADKRSSPCVVIQGGDEKAKGEVTLKDLVEGAKAAAAIKDNREWKAARPAQITVPEADMLKHVREILARHGGAGA